MSQVRTIVLSTPGTHQLAGFGPAAGPPRPSLPGGVGAVRVASRRGGPGAGDHCAGSCAAAAVAPGRGASVSARCAAQRLPDEPPQREPASPWCRAAGRREPDDALGAAGARPGARAAGADRGHRAPCPRTSAKPWWRSTSSGSPIARRLRLLGTREGTITTRLFRGRRRVARALGRETATATGTP